MFATGIRDGEPLPKVGVRARIAAVVYTLRRDRLVMLCKTCSRPSLQGLEFPSAQAAIHSRSIESAIGVEAFGLERRLQYLSITEHSNTAPHLLQESSATM